LVLVGVSQEIAAVLISFVQKNNNLLQFLAEIYNMTVETCTDDDSYCLPAGFP